MPSHLGPWKACSNKLPTQSQGAVPSPLSLLIPVTTWGSPRPPSGLIICQKESNKSLKAAMLLVMVYNSERIHIKISQEKRHVGQNPEKPYAERPDLLFQWNWGQYQFLPGMMWDKIHGVLPTSGAHLSLGMQGFFWGFSTQTCWAAHEADLQTLGGNDTAWSKDLTINHIGRLSSVDPGSQVNIGALIKQDIQTTQRSLPWG